MIFFVITTISWNHSRPNKIFCSYPIDEVVAKQLDLGIDIVNDGEIARETYFSHFVKRIKGMNPDNVVDKKIRNGELIMYYLFWIMHPTTLVGCVIQKRYTYLNHIGNWRPSVFTNPTISTSSIGDGIWRWSRRSLISITEIIRRHNSFESIRLGKHKSLG